MRRVLSAGLLVCFAALYGAESAQASNQWDFYRWPWQYQTNLTMGQGWNGVTSHTGNLYHAIDFDAGYGVYFQLFSADEGVATCGPDTSGTGLGNYVRVKHGSTDSTAYGHLDYCGFSGPTSIVQGFAIGMSGSSGVATGIHLHFQVNTSTTNLVSKEFSISGNSNFNWGGAQRRDCPLNGCPSYTSDNEAAGYDTSLNFYSTIHSKYVSSGGWSVVGSSAYSAAWQPCRINTQAVYGCSQNGYSGIVQTFLGVSGTANGRHAVLKSNAYSNAVFMSRSILGGYTDFWYGRHEGMWYVGYPTGDSYSIGGGQYRMNFQNGYVIFTQSTCNLKYYYWQSGFGYVLGHNVNYCD